MKRALESSATTLSSEAKIKIANEKDLYKRVMQDLIDVRRKSVYDMMNEKIYDEKVLRSLEHNLDLEESRLNKR